jgi:hypothetical protein
MIKLIKPSNSHGTVTANWHTALPRKEDVFELERETDDACTKRDQTRHEIVKFIKRCRLPWLKIGLNIQRQRSQTKKRTSLNKINA